MNSLLTRTLPKVFKMVLAIILSFVLANSILFCYERPVGWIDTPEGASMAIRRPNSIIVHGTEGFAISKMDENGFSNRTANLTDNFVLVMGSSYTQGKEVAYEDRYTSRMISRLSTNMKYSGVYNIACDGHFLPSLIKHFKSAVYNYSEAKCIVIEIGNTDFSSEELKDALNQPNQVDTRTANEVFSSQSNIEKIKTFIKEYVPILSIIKSNLKTAKLSAESTLKTYTDLDGYEKALIQCLSLIRSEYDGPIVFAYHPNTQLTSDGELKIVRSETIEIFHKVCQETGIDFIDVGDKFKERFLQTYELPYGFSNTTPGSGHLNEVGHKIMADAIIDYLEEVGCK